MSIAAANFETIACRRCGQPYSLPARRSRWLPRGCPACGASPRAFLADHGNRLAAVLAVLATVILSFGITAPFASMRTLGSERVVSLLGGIGSLRADGHVFVAALLATFSVAFPFAKLACLLAATSRLLPLRARWRRRLHAAAHLTGRYSMLDLLVVAVLIVVVKVRGVAEVEPRVGIALFTAAVLLSIAAGYCVRLDKGERTAA